ncbi:hypothetical protein OG802_17135 [Streptomyces sp. NBC_00704]|uniref:hypothetical protein n=1 Tax=Streptomyces sp. NBC_00704 TaxID=2975809 RepID=UPI002E370127|nr:hypothetical protein [Streptomyces sp. NBC_00704]
MTGDTMIEQAGFYRELGGADGGAAAPSLRDAARSTGERDEERLLAYLEASHEIYTVMGAERDVIADDVWITGAGSLITDGTYVWPTELAYYVRRHHVALLPEFAAHIRARNYVSPPVPREQALAIFEECLGENARATAAADAATAKGFFIWYRTALTRASAQNLIDQLATSGLFVRHPLTDNLFGFRDTVQGKREPLVGGVHTLLSALASDEYRNVEFQGWMGRDESLAVTVQCLDGNIQKLFFQISDIPAPDREDAVAALVRTLDQDAAECRGFVIDRAGVTASQDWDRILVGGGGRFTVWPDTVGILRDRVGDHPELADGNPTPYGPLDVFHRA